MSEFSSIQDSFPTLFSPNVAVPAHLPNNGWWHAASAPPIGGVEVASVDPTWSGQFQNLVRSGAMPETSYHYPSGGIRPGNNDPPFLSGFVSTMGGDQLCIPYQKPEPFDPKPFSLS